MQQPPSNSFLNINCLSFFLTCCFLCKGYLRGPPSKLVFMICFSFSLFLSLSNFPFFLLFSYHHSLSPSLATHVTLSPKVLSCYKSLQTTTRSYVTQKWPVSSFSLSFILSFSPLHYFFSSFFPPFFLFLFQLENFQFKRYRMIIKWKRLLLKFWDHQSDR